MDRSRGGGGGGGIVIGEVYAANVGVSEEDRREDAPMGEEVRGEAGRTRGKAEEAGSTCCLLWKGARDVRGGA